MKLTGSQALLECLLKERVDTIFGYPGGAIMPVYDALYDYREKIHHVLVRHEQGAAHAGQGYARVTGRAAVCLVTSGPGATNLVTGITDAMMDSVPLVCICGQVTKTLLGTDAFQEADIIGITTPITKWNYQITHAAEIPEIMAKAFAVAQTGRPGPVVIDITKNAQIEITEFAYEPYQGDIGGFRKQPLTDEALNKAANLLNEAEKPFMLIGHGVLIAKAQNEIRELAEKANIPVASTLHGLSAFPSDHPLFVGMLGMHGNYGPNILTNHADVILAVGMRFDDRVTGKLSEYAPRAKVIHIDIDHAEVNKNVNTEVALITDAKEAVEALLPRVCHNDHAEWLNEFRLLYQQEYEKVIEKEIFPTDEKITMSEAIRVLNEITNGDAIIVADVGQHQMMAARYYRFKSTDSFITSGGLGTMGFALPAGIGAKIAAPEREVVVVVGDGGFQMTFQELGTIAQENLAVKVIILNNNFLGMVRQWQELFFENRYSFVHLQNPDFVKICEGFGIKARRVSQREELSAAIAEMSRAKESYVLDIVVAKEQNVFPMIPAGAGVSEIRLA